MKVMKANNMFDVSENYTGITKRSDGTKHWFLNGKHHRIDGPAVIWPDGTKYWFLNGKLLDEQKINQLVKKFNYPIETAIKLVFFFQKKIKLTNEYVKP